MAERQRRLTDKLEGLLHLARSRTYDAQVAWAFLLLCVSGLANTLNALWPVRRHRPLIVQSFFAGWLTSEAPLHHLCFQLVATIAFVVAGALQSYPGWIGLALCLPSWAGLWHLYRVAVDTAGTLEDVLSEALGQAYRTRIRHEAELDAALPRGRLLLPVWLTDATVRAVKHIAYGPLGRHHTLNLYLPRAPVHKAPVLLQIHGGGWTIGHKSQQGRPLVHYMAARGWVCVSINYRLSPRAKWPEQLLDAKLALRWIKEHIAEFGGDPDFVAVTGGSAGGHLTTMLALTPNDPRFQPGFEHVDTRVQAAIPFYAVYDFLDREKQQLHPGLRMVLEYVVVQKKLEHARELFESGSPLSHLRADAPPFLVLHGTHDSLACVEEARLFVSRLREVSDSAVAYAELRHAQHAFEVFHSPRTLQVIRAVHRFAEAIYADHLAGAGRPSHVRPRSHPAVALSAE